MKKIRTAAVLFLIISFLTLASCAMHQYEGGTAGGVFGGIAGALLDSKNPWRGGMIGAGLGALAGATISDISVRGSRQTAATGNPSVYRTDDGRAMYWAEPASDVYYPDEKTKCRKVQERVYENGQLVKDTLKEICESTKTEKRY
ncbi:MAG: glycine zipper 2TM domain-containing protein [Dissulfurispiraceae bacterium]|nr:glycine zipper 2TM domain-containing protein [Dissulfurispiraceae bacterium]